MSAPAASREEAPTPWRGAALVGAFALWPLVAWGGHLGHAPLAALAGLLALHGWRRPPLDLAWRFLFALLGWAVVSTAWSTAETGGFSLDSYEALEQRTWLKLLLQALLYAAVVLAAAALSPLWAHRVATAVGVSAVALAAMLLLEAATGARLYLALRDATGDPYRPDLGMRNVSLGGYALAVLAWPALAALWSGERRRLALVVVVAALVSPPLFGAFSPLAAFLVGATVFFAVRAAPHASSGLVGLASAALTVTTPLLVRTANETGLLAAMAPNVGASWAERLRIWAFTTDQIAAAPFFGQGLDASRTFGAAVPLHPHSASLQLWLELGAVGAALAGLFWVVLFSAAGRLGGRDRTMAACACAAAASYFTIGALSFGVWQEWWLAVGALGAAAVLAVARSRRALGLADDTPIFADLKSS